MKRILTLALSLSLILTGVMPQSVFAAGKKATPIAFSNKGLEAEIKESYPQLGKLTTANIQKVKKLEIRTDEVKTSKDIEKLVGLESFSYDDVDRLNKKIKPNWDLAALNKLPKLKEVTVYTIDSEMASKALQLKVPNLVLKFYTENEQLSNLDGLKNASFKSFTFYGHLSDWTAVKEASKRMKITLELYDSIDEAIADAIETNKYNTIDQSSEQRHESPTFERWHGTTTAFMTYNSDKTITLVDTKDNTIIIETYDQARKFVSKKEMQPELPLVGAVYFGKTYNYIAYGQLNEKEDNAKEVIRIVKYDKDFNKVSSASVNGGDSYTTIPFDCSTGQLAEEGNTLVLHTARERYKTPDGLNHQSQLTITVDTASMKVTNTLGKFQPNHVSHSFDQYALFDGGKQVLLDHGDAYPRAIVLNKQSGTKFTPIDMYKIPGSIGANCTGVSVGGFKASSSHYLVAMNSVDHSQVSSYTSFEMNGLKEDVRDILLCTLPKNSISSADAKQITLEKYVGTSKIGSIPHLVKISDDKLMVLWQEFNKDNYDTTGVKYVYVNAAGEPLSEPQLKKNAFLTTGEIAVTDNEVVWYTTKNNVRTFYSIAIQ